MSSETDQPPWIVALTGGIASGKSAVSDRFASLGVPVIDTDRIAHELVEPRKPLLASIVSAFGAHLLDAEGRLMRRTLRDIVFSDAQQRAQLEAIMHPAIRAEALRRIRALHAPYCILVVPLLAETRGFMDFNRVLLVEASEEKRIKRVMHRDGIGRDQALAMIRAQATPEQRRQIADDVIHNDGPLSALDEQVSKLNQMYLGMAQQRPQ